MEKYAKEEYEQGALGHLYEMSCPAVINGLVGVEAEVSISPHVEAGPTQLQCIGSAKLGPAPGASAYEGKCSFTVHQLVRLRIPLTISAVALAKPGKAVCDIEKPSDY
jgi:hypothetical protein